MVLGLSTATINVLIGAGIGFVASVGVELLRGWLERDRMRDALLVEVNIIGRSLEEYRVAYCKYRSKDEEFDSENPWRYAGMSKEDTEYVSPLSIRQTWREDDPLKKFSQRIDSSSPTNIYTANTSGIGHLSKYESNELQRFYVLVQEVRESIENREDRTSEDADETYYKHQINVAMRRRKRVSSVLSASWITRFRWWYRGQVPVVTNDLLEESDTKNPAPTIDLESDPTIELDIEFKGSR